LRLWDNNLVLVFRVCGNLANLRADQKEICDVGWFPYDSLPATCSPRTRRIVGDALLRRAPSLVTFRSPSDSGTPSPTNQTNPEVLP
jgi:hypothetical protein